MNTIVVWLLISTSQYASGAGVANVIERFASAVDCEYVRKEMHGMADGIVKTKCVQAKIVERVNK